VGVDPDAKLATVLCIVWHGWSDSYQFQLHATCITNMRSMCHRKTERLEVSQKRDNSTGSRR